MVEETQLSVSSKFSASLEGYLRKPDELALLNGYEAVRQELLQGSGFFLDFVGTFQNSLSKAMAGKRADEAIITANYGLQFLMNSLAPIEMVLRANRDVASHLLHLNEQLEARVAERTWELAQRVRELTALNEMAQERQRHHIAYVEAYRGLLQRLRGSLQEAMPAVGSGQEPSQLLNNLIAQLSALVTWAESQPLPDLQQP